MNIYLYIKRCEHCGLRYFGKTINPNIEKYTGSGHHWLRHIKKHGKNISTVEVWKFTNSAEATEFALKFSKDNNIVESAEWANLIPEDGLDGNSSAVITEELRAKFRKANAGANNPMYGTFWINNGSENKKVRSEREIPAGWQRGRYIDATSTWAKSFNKRDSKGSKNSNYGVYWWTDGVDSVKSTECPAAGWYRGQGAVPKTTNKSNTGRFWWTNGITTKMSKESPGPEWRRGKTVRV